MINTPYILLYLKFQPSWNFIHTHIYKYILTAKIYLDNKYKLTSDFIIKTILAYAV